VCQTSNSRSKLKIKTAPLFEHNPPTRVSVLLLSFGFIVVHHYCLYLRVCCHHICFILTHTNASAHTHTHEHTYSHALTHAHTHADTHPYTHTNAPTEHTNYKPTQTHTCTLPQSHTHSHTHTCTQSHDDTHTRPGRSQFVVLQYYASARQRPQ